MKTQARSISTNQTGVHEDLLMLVKKHQQHRFKRPIADHTQQAFGSLIAWLADWRGSVIIDAGCGVGESTINIASQHPQHKVIGIDKSVTRLDKHRSYAHHDTQQKAQNSSNSHNNYILLQADLNDFWRLLVAYIETKKPAWHVSKQYILYPNPYPKKSQLSKRWHGSALLPYIMKVSLDIELRSNWQLYLEEFAQAALLYNAGGQIEAVTARAITPFERKYQEAGQTCFKLQICASGCDK